MPSKPSESDLTVVLGVVDPNSAGREAEPPGASREESLLRFVPRGRPPPAPYTSGVSPLTDPSGAVIGADKWGRFKHWQAVQEHRLKSCSMTSHCPCRVCKDILPVCRSKNLRFNIYRFCTAGSPTLTLRYSFQRSSQRVKNIARLLRCTSRIGSNLTAIPH